MDHSLSSGKTAEVPRSSWRQSILVDNSNDQSSSTQMLSTLANSDSISAISALLQLHQQQGQQEQQQIILQHQEQQELLQQQQQEKLLVQKQQQQQQIQHLIHQVGQQQQQQKNLQYQNQVLFQPPVISEPRVFTLLLHVFKSAELNLELKF